MRRPLAASPVIPQTFGLMVNSRRMEPIRHTLTARLKYLKMYREDLDQLVAMFVRDCKTVTISDSKYRYDSLDEMKQKTGPTVKDLDIRGENPGVRFLFNQTEITRIGKLTLLFRVHSPILNCFCRDIWFLYAVIIREKPVNRDFQCSR